MFSETKLEICKSKFSGFPTAGQGRQSLDDTGQQQTQQICFYLLQETLVRHALHLSRGKVECCREIGRKAQRNPSIHLMEVWTSHFSGARLFVK